MSYAFLRLLAAALMTQVQIHPESDPECRKAMADFSAGMKKVSELDRASAVRDLSRHRCETSLGALASLLTQDAVAVRAEAAGALGAFDHPKAVDSLGAAVFLNLKSGKVLEAIAGSLGTLGWESGAASLHPLLKKDDDPDVAESLDEVVRALGKLGSPLSVDPLVEFLERCEAEGKGAGRRLRGEAMMKALEGPTAKALGEITGTARPNAREWEKWWRENQARLLASATLVYRCKATGKRFSLKPGIPGVCPFHDKPEKDARLVATRLVEKKSE